mgnify:CR=1 FL=1
MTWDHPRGFESLIESNPSLIQACDISVDWQARSLLAFGDQHISEFYKDFDLMIIDHPHVPDAVHANAVLPVTDYLSPQQVEILERTSVGQSHNSYMYQGKIWSLAIDTAAQVSAYRPDKADGSPIFWSDVLKLARDGKLLWPHKPVDAFSTFATLCAQLGRPLASTENFVESGVASKALELMVELSGLVPDFCLNSNPIDIAERLSTTDDFLYGVCMYGYSNYSRDGFKKHILVYDDVPSFDGLAGGSQLGGAGIAISSATSNPEKAAIAAFYLSEPVIQSSVYGRAGGQPGNLVAWKNHQLNKITHNFFENTLRTLERAWVRPRILGWPDVQYQSSLIIHEVLKKKSFNSGDISAIQGTFDKYILEGIK